MTIRLILYSASYYIAFSHDSVIVCNPCICNNNDNNNMTSSQGGGQNFLGVKFNMTLNCISGKSGCCLTLYREIPMSLATVNAADAVGCHVKFYPMKNPQKPLLMDDLDPHQIMVPRAYTSQHLKWHLSQFILFCKANTVITNILTHRGTILLCSNRPYLASAVVGLIMYSV